MSALTASCSNSYQSSSPNTIECPICLEDTANNLSLMAKCRHSWCYSCNEKLNNNNIAKCPICKLEFEPFIKNGKWIYRNKRFVWKRGILDTEKKVRWKRREAFLYNLFEGVEPNMNLMNV